MTVKDLIMLLLNHDMNMQVVFWQDGKCRANIADVQGGVALLKDGSEYELVALIAREENK